ncbi:zinc finger protein 778-like isoform X2 [Dreissena polymorpha]|uniref:zinc finger protein 778-like isoform X2 n=1 Tax=Dreissena polymorpha TaxID=45954 RepID=UPI002263B9B1|nr:zinc finger protein 778-like isoform X2 [Dreissena polymorpha]
MAAPKSYSSSSSSEEDEELAKIKEAVDSSNNFLNIKSENVGTSGQSILVNEGKCVGTLQKNGSPQGLTCHDLPPSKRPDKEVVEDEVKAYFPQTTPGFRKHVAKKLSESLDSSIHPVADGFKTKQMKDITLEGIRLFASSKACISAVTTQTQVTQPVRKRKVSSSSDSRMSESELMNAANGSLLDISLEEKSSTSERFSCGICEESYYRKASLNRHLKTHENGCIKCSVCTQFFKTEEDKKKHIEVKHSPIVCESCGKIFSSRNYIEFHKKTHEAELVNYDKQCPFANCGKIFRQSSKFQDHLNTHTGAKPYSCEHCRKTFNSRELTSAYFLKKFVFVLLLAVSVAVTHITEG